jgi:hypothetical protein
MPSLAEAAVALGLEETWDLSVLKDDGTFVVPNSGVGGAAGGLAPFTRTIAPSAPLPENPVWEEEIDPVAAKATADAYNARYGMGMAAPWRPDPKSPPRPGVPAQREITQDAKGSWWNLDERRPNGVQVGNEFHKGDWGGVLDKVLPDGYAYTATDEQDCARLDKLALLMGHSGGVIDGSSVQAILPRVDFLRAEVNGAAAPGETLATWTARNSQPPPVGSGKYLSPYYDNLGVLRQTPLPIPAPITQPQPPSQQSTAGPSVAPPAPPTPLMPSGNQAPPANSGAGAPSPRDGRLLGRFSVSGSYISKKRSLAGEISFGALADGYGLVTFLGDAQAIVKMVNGAAVNGNFWVFISPLTDVGCTLVVKDELTGHTKAYTGEDERIAWTYDANGQKATVAVVQDTAAFKA